MKIAKSKRQIFGKNHPFFSFQFDICNLQFIFADSSNG